MRKIALTDVLKQNLPNQRLSLFFAGGRGRIRNLSRVLFILGYFLNLWMKVHCSTLCERLSFSTWDLRIRTLLQSFLVQPLHNIQDGQTIGSMILDQLSHALVLLNQQEFSTVNACTRTCEGKPYDDLQSNRLTLSDLLLILQNTWNPLALVFTVCQVYELEFQTFS